MMVAATKDEALKDTMAESFANEETSQEILLDQSKRDAGATVQTDAGVVRRVPTGYVDELRKGRAQRASLSDYPARPSSVTLFAWNGVPSEVPIAYEPGGANPSISRYLRKKHCQACGLNGFITPHCIRCNSGEVIQFFYQNYDAVPSKRDWYGDVACICSSEGEMGGECPRDGVTRVDQKTGFLSPQQMLMHASSKHPREYGIWQTLGRRAAVASPDPAAMREAMKEDLKAEILAELKKDQPGAAAEQEEAPLYVSDKDRDKAAVGEKG
jgi:hypothetical protein